MSCARHHSSLSAGGIDFAANLLARSALRWRPCRTLADLRAKRAGGDGGADSKYGCKDTVSMAVTPDSSSRKRLAIFRIGIGKTARLTALAPRTSARDGRAAFPRAKAQPEPAGARTNRERQDGAEDSVDGQHYGEEHQTTLARGDWPDHRADDQIEQPEQESQGESVPATYGKGVDGLGDTSDDEDLGKRTLQDVIQITICPSVCPWRAQAEPPSHRGWLAAPPLGLGETEQWHSSAGSCGDAAQGAHFSQRT